MAATYSIAVVGDWESVMGFRALGLDTYPVTSLEEARKTVHDLAKTDCAVIYLTETLAKNMAGCAGSVQGRDPARHHPDPRPGRLSGHWQGQYSERNRAGRRRGCSVKI